MVCFGQLLRIKLRAKHFLITVDDVWDEDSAYLEMLAEQVKKNYLLLSADSFLMTCTNECLFVFYFSSWFRVHLFEKELKAKRLMRTTTLSLIRSKRSWAFSVL